MLLLQQYKTGVKAVNSDSVKAKRTEKFVCKPSSYKVCETTTLSLCRMQSIIRDEREPQNTNIVTHSQSMDERRDELMNKM